MTLTDHDDDLRRRVYDAPPRVTSSDAEVGGRDGRRQDEARRRRR